MELRKNLKATSVYDENNVFAKILRGEIPCKKLFENDYALAFEDLYPQRKHHVLVIPKGKFNNLDDFTNNASEVEISELFKAISHVASELGISASEGGYRVISNIGINGGQEVPHLHFHSLGGERVGKMLQSKTNNA